MSGATKVLLVDDEDSMRDSLKRVLLRKGFEVFDAPNGEEALRILTERSSPVDVLVADIRMGGMGGYELADAVRRLYPETPVVYISGYASSEELKAHNHPETGEAFLAKPFLSSALVGAIDAVLPSRRRLD